MEDAEPEPPAEAGGCEGGPPRQPRAEALAGAQDLDKETLRDLEIARKLAERGVPVVVLRPLRDENGNWDAHKKPGYRYPDEWQNSVADPSVIDEWRPGDALIMVTGRGVDVVDVDPRNGGDESAESLLAQGAYPRSYGHQTTPSGGYHDLVAPLHVPTATGLRPGIDVLAGGPEGSRDNAFLPPTRRVNKVTGEVERYQWVQVPNFDGMTPGDESGVRLAQMARDKKNKKDKTTDEAGSEQIPPQPVYHDMSPSDRARADTYLQGVVRGTGAEFETLSKWPEGHRDPDRPGVGWQKAVADACYRFGSLARAPWTRWSMAEAKENLSHAIHPDVLQDVDLETEWAAHSGRKAPAPYPFTEEGMTDDPPADGRRSSWTPVDLTDFLRGAAPLLPTVGRLDDDAYLFYRGRVNGIAGTPVSGKSWTVFLVAAQELALGHNVVFIDFEDDETGIVDRLRRLGVGDALLAGPEQAFHYVHPLDPYTEEERRHMEALVTRLSPSIVVIDSAGPALSLNRSDQNNDDDVARWFQLMPLALARLGPAVVLVDHTAKAAEHGMWPIGSQRKLAAITGAQYMQEQVRNEGFDKFTPGRATITCAKDRHGNHRKGSVVAELVFDLNDGFSLRRGIQSAPPSVAEMKFELMERVSLAVEAAEGPLNTNELSAEVTGKKSNIIEAAKALVKDGFLNVADGPRGANLYSSVKPFRCAEGED